MQMIKAAFYLSLLHIAGDNIAVVPDMTLIAGSSMYITVILAYLVFGAMLTGILAWIGVTTGQELNKVVTDCFGSNGKKYWALTTLMVCIPASSLTGGYFTGIIIHTSFGISVYYAIPVCIIIYSLLTSDLGAEFLKISNSISFLFIPMIILLFYMNVHEYFIPDFSADNIDWVSVFALAGYNIGGMRSLLVVETSTYLFNKGYNGVYLSLAAKILEGVFTLSIVYLIISAGGCGPFVLLNAAMNIFSGNVSFIFSIILFCIFTNTMAPAMMVNAKQISILTNLPFNASLLIAGIAVCFFSFIHYYSLLIVICLGTIALIIFIIFTVLQLHKPGVNK